MEPAEEDHAKPAKRPPASPCIAKIQQPPVGQSPAKSREQKKQKVERSSRVEAYVADIAEKSTPPIGPMMDLDDDVLDRSRPSPRKLETEFEALANPETLVESAEDSSFLAKQ